MRHGDLYLHDYAGLREIPPSIMAQDFVRDAAMKRAISWVQEQSRKLLALKPLQVDISTEDLETIQQADNNVFSIIHQWFKDIPRTCELLWQLLWTHANTHFIMKPSVPAPWIFKAGGWVVLKRGKELKKEATTWKIDTRWHLLRPEELAPFLGKFMETPGRNVVIYSQGTRAKSDLEGKLGMIPYVFNPWKRNTIREERLERAFYFRPAVIKAMNEQIQATPNANHVCVALDYRRDNEVRATIKVLREEDKGDKDTLGTSVNGFLQQAKQAI